MRLRIAILVLFSFVNFRPATYRAADRPPATKPNVLILLADDMTFSAIQSLDGKGALSRSAGVRTPTLDSLVRQGTTFTNAYIMGGLVPAVCSPSRSMLLTGRGLYHLELPDGKQLGTYPLTGRYETMPQTFQRAWYVTFTTGKHHNGSTELALGYSEGHSLFLGGMADHVGTPGYELSPDGTYPPANARPATRHSSEEYAAQTIAFLERQATADKPFWAYVPFRAPHDPRQPPAAYRAMYDPARLALPGNVLPDHPFDNGEMTVRDEMLLPRPRDPKRIQAELADYYAMITHLDAQIGRILATLRQTGKAENTVVVFAADNGLALGQHGLLGKQNLYEHSMRIPMVWAGPGIPKNQRRSALVYLHDVFPTVCAMAGLDVPTSVESKNLAPAMQNAKAATRPTVYLSYGKVQRALRDERYKLIEYVVNGTRTTQLFDEQADPLELTNLASQPAHRQRVERMRVTLQRERTAQGDTTAQFWSRF